MCAFGGGPGGTCCRENRDTSREPSGGGLDGEPTSGLPVIFIKEQLGCRLIAVNSDHQRFAACQTSTATAIAKIVGLDADARSHLNLHFYLSDSSRDPRWPLLLAYFFCSLLSFATALAWPIDAMKLFADGGAATRPVKIALAGTLRP
jgi:hypothetical protein